MDSHVNSTTIGIELSELAVSDCVSIIPRGEGRGSVNDFSANKKGVGQFPRTYELFFFESGKLLSSFRSS